MSRDRSRSPPQMSHSSVCEECNAEVTDAANWSRTGSICSSSMSWRARIRCPKFSTRRPPSSLASTAAKSTATTSRRPYPGAAYSSTRGEHYEEPLQLLASSPSCLGKKKYIMPQFLIWPVATPKCSSAGFREKRVTYANTAYLTKSSEKARQHFFM